MGGLVGGGGNTLQVVGGQVCVLRLGILGRWRQALVWGQRAMLIGRGTLETHGGGLMGLPIPRGLLLALEQTLVSPLTHWGFMRPLLWLQLRPIGAQRWTPLWPHARVHLPCIGGHAVGLLVLRVWSRVGGLLSSMRMGDGIGWRLQGRVPCNLCGSG